MIEKYIPLQTVKNGLKRCRYRWGANTLGAAEKTPAVPIMGQEAQKEPKIYYYFFFRLEAPGFSDP